MIVDADAPTADFRRPSITQHDVLLVRAQAVVDADTSMIALCDRALGRRPSETDLAQLDPGAADSMRRLTAREATNLVAAELRVRSQGDAR